MNKQLARLTLNIALLSILSSTHIQAAAQFPAINIKACGKLWRASYDGNLEAAKEALAQGTDINAYAGMYAKYEEKRPQNFKLPRSTPLLEAVTNGHSDMVKFLLQQGACADAVICGSTPLIEICKQRSLARPRVKAIITELLAHKANVNAQDCILNSTPLHWAIYALESKSIARQLILAGADSTIENFKKQTALDKIKSGAMHAAVSEARATRKKAFQQLPVLEKAMHVEMIKNFHISIPELANLFSPFYTDQRKDQPAYDLLNTHIAEQWQPIMKRLERAREEKLEMVYSLLSQPDCLPVADVAGIACDYLFSPQQ